MKVSELEGEALDYWVAKTEGCLQDWLKAGAHRFAYSGAWVHGGPIIDRERIAIWPYGVGKWAAEIPNPERIWVPGSPDLQSGNTPLIAAMRCFVASKLGVDLPAPLPDASSWKR